MDHRLYKLRFQNAVHFGKTDLDEGEYTCCADTIFSALCQEAVKIGADTLQTFYQYAKDGALLLSDAFPYMGDTYFLPKPMKRIENAEHDGDSVIKKAYKKLRYIPADMLDTYLQGKYDILHAPDFDRLGHFEIKESVAIRGKDEPGPYRIGTYYYNEGNGSYLIVGYQDERAEKLLEDLFINLSYSGLGGKRASGFGRFTFYSKDLPSGLTNRLKAVGDRYMSLSVALPREDELETTLDGAEYLLCKRSGFVASDQYAPEQMRKKDLYVFRAGSCYSTRFCGDIYDVSGKGGRHPVYRYAKPMLMEVGTWKNI